MIKKFVEETRKKMRSFWIFCQYSCYKYQRLRNPILYFYSRYLAFTHGWYWSKLGGNYWIVSSILCRSRQVWCFRLGDSSCILSHRKRSHWGSAMQMLWFYAVLALTELFFDRPRHSFLHSSLLDTRDETYPPCLQYSLFNSVSTVGHCQANLSHHLKRCYFRTFKYSQI